MSFLLDTNVVSEWMKPQPHLGVIAWLDQVDEDRTFLSVVTLTELRYGVDRLPAGTRRKRFEDWLEHDLPLRFEGRILSIDGAIADAGGRLLSQGDAAGRPMQGLDALIAATAHVHGLTLVTRNVADFEATTQSILNPWMQR